MYNDEPEYIKISRTGVVYIIGEYTQIKLGENVNAEKLGSMLGVSVKNNQENTR